MGHSYSQIFIHLVFSTKQRAPIISPEFEEKLNSYIINSGKKFDMQVLAIGGTENHLHVLLILPPKLSVSEAARIIKGGSSKWINDQFMEERKFRWQRGYGAFSINKSLVPTTIKYIKNQKEHHQSISYQEEFTKFLDRHKIDYRKQKLFY